MFYNKTSRMGSTVKPLTNTYLPMYIDQIIIYLVEYNLPVMCLLLVRIN